MILVRDIFHLKFGKAKDARLLLKEATDIGVKHGFEKIRALTDMITGHSYTLILESQWNSLADWESAAKKGTAAEDWQKWYAKFSPLVESASREVLNILD